VGLKDQRAQLDLLVSLDHLDLLVYLVSQEIQDLLVRQALQVSQEALVQSAILVILDLPEHRAPMVTPVLQASLDSQVPLDLLERLVFLERLA